jgi:hypothetical protein
MFGPVLAFSASLLFSSAFLIKMYRYTLKNSQTATATLQGGWVKYKDHNLVLKEQEKTVFEQGMIEAMKIAFVHFGTCSKEQWSRFEFAINVAKKVPVKRISNV